MPILILISTLPKHMQCSANAGGILSVQYATAILSHVSMISGSASSSNGGCIFVDQGVANISHSSLTSCSSNNLGGGVYLSQTLANFSDVTFESNYAPIDVRESFRAWVQTPACIVSNVNTTSPGRWYLRGQREYEPIKCKIRVWLFDPRGRLLFLAQVAVVSVS